MDRLHENLLGHFVKWNGEGSPTIAGVKYGKIKAVYMAGEDVRILIWWFQLADGTEVSGPLCDYFAYDDSIHLTTEIGRG